MMMEDLAHIPHPIHFSVIKYSNKFEQTPAGQRLSTTCAKYSSLKCFIVDRTGFGAVCPNPHNEFALIYSC